HLEYVLHFGARDARAVHRTRRAHALPSEIDPGEVRERAPGADHVRAAPVSHGKRLLDRVADVFSQLAYVLRAWRVAEETFRQPKRAERKRNEAVHESLGRKRELERASADVHHHRAPVPELEVGERAAKGEARLLLADEHADPEPRFLPHARDER